MSLKKTKKHEGAKDHEKNQLFRVQASGFFCYNTTLTTFFQKGLLKNVKIYKINQEITNNSKNFKNQKLKT